ncbi:Carboxylesterase [Cadophora sp. DSE1049]|nr:Carboxylesterase [Cadophora sp. DSE1049]
MNLIFSIITILLLFSNPAISSQPPCSQGNPVAVISNGIIIGTTASLPAATPINKYLGIPFAKSPPVRFSPPTSASPWSEPLNATAFAPSCIQQVNSGSFLSNYSNTISPIANESEDCLYLNIFQPGGVPPSNGWPVMIWIYGGGLAFGSSSLPVYDGSNFAAYEDVILVSFNYRLNVFGFPAAPDLPQNETNLGYLDQRYALEWVQDNIDSFGGDPEKVTIFGESSGAISVDSILIAPPSPLPFRAAIIQSGNIIGQNLGNLGADTTRGWLTLVSALNCSAANDTLPCVRRAPASTIKRIIQEGSLSFNPVVDNMTFVSSATRSRTSGRAAQVPLVVGSTANEGTLFTYGQNNLTAFIQSTFTLLPQIQSLVTQSYRVGSPGIANESQAISQIFTEIGVQCPLALLANQSTAAGNPTWRYYYNATFENLSPVPGLGVYHSSELPLVFGTYPRDEATAQQEALSQFMRGAWARFARNPLQGPGWGKVGSFDGTDLGVLESFGASGVEVVDPQKTILDARCALYSALYSFVG